MTVFQKPTTITPDVIESFKRATSDPQQAKSSASIDHSVYSIVQSSSEPLTVNEVYAIYCKNAKKSINSVTIRTSLINLTRIGLLSRRPQTDAERHMLGMTIGKRAYLYSPEKTVPPRTVNMAVPGIVIKPLPDTYSAQQKIKRMKAKAKARKSVPARQAPKAQTGASKPNALERHDSAITEMQERISSLEAQLQNLQRILR